MEFKFKRIVFTILMVLFILASASVVSAGNINVVGDDFSSIESAVNQSSSGDTVILDAKTYSGNGKSISFDYSPTVHTLTITTNSANSRATLDAGKVSRIAYVSKDYTVKFSNINFYNGNAGAGDGGAILNAGTITLQNCQFIGNIAKNGGAISSVNNNLGRSSIETCVFTNNRATASGGAIYDSVSNLNIRSSIFNSNTAINGGAIFLAPATAAYVIERSNFNNNVATSSGGALYLSQVYCTIEYSSFVGNRAQTYGSAIYNINTVDGLVDLFGPSFSNNLVIPKMYVSVPSFVNCTNVATLYATISGANNINNAIYNVGNRIKINYITPTQTNSLAGQTITLLINGKTFSAKTDSSGKSTFQFSTAGFPVNSLSIKFTSLVSASYSSISVNSVLRITNYKIVKVTYKPTGKDYKKATTTKLAKLVNPIYKLTKTTVFDKYYSIVNNEYTLSGKREYIQTMSRQVGSTIKWVKLTTKNSNTYRWNEQRQDTTNYKKGTRTTITYLNGKQASKVTKKNVKYKVVKSKKIRDDWTGYLAATNDCNPKSAGIQKLIKQITKGKKTDTQKANAVWNWVIKNVKYDYDIYGGTRWGSDGMLSTKKGNCLDHCHLTIALFRAAGLPAVYEYKARTDGSAPAWTKVYVNGKWLYADTVIKSGSMRGQPSWTNAKVLNNDPNNHFIVINYNKHKNIKINAYWVSLYREVIYDGTTTPVIIYNL